MSETVERVRIGAPNNGGDGTPSPLEGSDDRNLVGSAVAMTRVGFMTVDALAADIGFLNLDFAIQRTIERLIAGSVAKAMEHR